jgi:nitrate reductase delta subunit
VGSAPGDRRPATDRRESRRRLRGSSERLVAAFEEIEDAIAALPRSQAKDSLGRFAGYVAVRTQLELAAAYVETFDLRRHTSLYLTWYVHGDTRRRGMALLRLKRLYAAAGLELAGDELPDYLPLVLEFAALAPDDAGDALLREHRPSLEHLRRALHEDESPYADLLDALCAGLPRLSALERERIRSLAAEGPPTEQVGLEPFAPPEVMLGARA